jgi:HEPN domain-containing protein
VIEKLLKAVCIYKTESEIPPRTHDLLYLAEKSGIETTDAQKDALDLITTFNISARYPDYKKSFYNKCTKKFTLVHLNLIKELRQWLLNMG